MPLIRKQEHLEVEGPYARLRLTNNPFPADPIIRPRSPDPRVNGSIFADGCRREVITRFEQMLIRPRDFTNRARLALLWSDGDKESGRGTGKTALLRHFQHRINRDWGQTEFGSFNAAVIYLAFPDQIDRLYSEQLAWAALLDAEESGLIRAAAASLRMNEVERRWPAAAKILAERVEQSEAAGTDGVSVLYDEDCLAQCELTTNQLAEAVVERLVDVDVEEDVAAAFAMNTLEDYLRSFRRDGKVRPYWVPRDTKGLNAARDIFLDQLVKFLDETGFAGAYLFIDDIENLTDQMANKEAIEFAKELCLAFLRPGRAAGDRSYFSAVLTTHQQAATKLARGWSEAGLQGVARLDPGADTSVRVPLPTEDGALEMMAEYIQEFRSAGPAVDRLHPFTEAAARKLVSGVKPALHPRTFLLKAHLVVKAAADDGAEVIDVGAIDRIFNESGAHSTAAETAVGVVEHEDY